MAIAPGQQLLHYSLIEKIGQGGMGVVWKAEDTKLRRDVAIKLLPFEFAEDHDRLVRLEREAKLLASLNHPNVAGIHGLEEDRGLHFLVLELIPGESLGTMLSTGPLPIDEALDIACQVAEGLGAAHAAGVIHRDLKPDNVRVTADGTAKVLDFGLAKGTTDDGVASQTNLSLSPTMTNIATQDGVILGTAPYMSPEQARGKTLDKRTDIWSFGCLLYECLTGKPTFRGESVTDILSLILQREPDWSMLPERTPPRVRELLQRCLERSARNRLQDIGDARIELQRAGADREWTTSGIQAAVAQPTAVPNALRGAGWFVLGGLVGAAMLFGVWRIAGAPASSPGDLSNPSTVRFSIAAPDGVRLSAPKVSPDGASVLYRAFDTNAEDRENATQVLIRRFDSYELQPVEGAERNIALAFSPDNAWLAFVAPRVPGSAKLRIFKSPVDGSAPPLAIGDWPDDAHNSLVWLPDGDLVATSNVPNHLFRFPTDGSPQPEPMAIEGAGSDTIFDPSDALPDGRHVLGNSYRYEGSGFKLDVAILSLETAEMRTLVREGGVSVWSPTGHIVFSRGNNLLALPFDAATLEVTGGPVTLMSDLSLPDGVFGYFDLSHSGTLAYQSEGARLEDGRLMILDRQGQVTPWSDERHAFEGYFRISRDGRRVAVEMINQEDLRVEIWISDTGRSQLRPFATEQGMSCSIPTWLPDGGSVVYACWDLFKTQFLVRAVDGSAEPVLLGEYERSEGLQFPMDISPDGAWLAVGRSAGDRMDILLVPMLDSKVREDEQIALITDLPNAYATFSPDGRFIAYINDESGRNEIYVGEYLGGRLGRVHRVSSGGGGGFPMWRRVDGETLELAYSKKGRLMSALITTAPEVRISEPQPLDLDLIALRSMHRRLLPDGRFLFTQKPEEQEANSRIHVVLNFHDEIRRRAAGAR